jgi:hypothetical protein
VQGSINLAARRGGGGNITVIFVYQETGKHRGVACSRLRVSMGGCTGGSILRLYQDRDIHEGVP